MQFSKPAATTTVTQHAQLIQIKRIYDQPGSSDGYRVLVDRLWPRGVSKSAAQLDEWLKDIAPTNDLRIWFNHDPDRWACFVERYRGELLVPKHFEELARLKGIAGTSTLTLVFSARSESQNNAVVLRDVITGLDVQ